MSDFPPPPQARRAVACLATVGFFLSMDISLTNLLIEPVKQDMALSDMQVALLQGTAFGLALGIGSIPLGRLIDRAPRVPLLRIALLVWILAMGASGLALNFWAMVASRVALGLVAALLIPAVVSLIADFCPPERRSVATSLFIVGQAGGQAFGIAAGGWALDGLTRLAATDPTMLFGLAPWRLTFLAAAGVGAFLLILLMPMREPARQEQQQTSPRIQAALNELWAYRGFLLPLLAGLLLAQFTLQAATVWSPPALMRGFGLSPGEFSGWLGAVFFAGGIAGAFLAGRLGEFGRRRAGRRGVLLPAFISCIGIVPASFFALAPNVSVFAALLGLSMLLNVIVATLGAVAITLNIPNELRGLVLGANSFFSGVFSFGTAPAAIALLSGMLGGETQLGLAIALASAPAAALAAAGFALAMRARLSDEGRAQLPQ